jgi:hypothetical protein
MLDNLFNSADEPSEQEIVNESPEQEVSDELVEETPSNPIEAKARAQGWVSQEEWVSQGKDADLWHDAKTHVNNRSFLDAIENQGKTIKRQQAMIDSMAVSLAKSDERAYQQAMRDLEAQKFQAQQERDFNKYEQTIRAIDQAKSEFKQPLSETDKAAQEAAEIRGSDYFKRFEAANPWINEKTPLARAKQAFSTEIGTEFKAANPNATNEQICDFVTEKVAQEFGRTKVSIKATPAQGQSKSSSSRVDMELTKEQKNMIRYFKNKNDDAALKHYMKALEAESNSSRKSR